MGKLSQYQSNKAPLSGNNHWATDDEKETLELFGVPFWLESSVVSDSPFKNDKTGETVRYIEYGVRLDTSSDDYKMAERRKQFNYTELVIKLPVDKDRMDDLEKMIDMGYKGSTDPDFRLKLIAGQQKAGRKPYYKLTDFTE